jgi:predicted dehydrogenase
VAVCDINEERATAAAVEHGSAVYTAHREMLDGEWLEAVFVAIPPGSHTTEVRDVALAGIPVFTAKPVALDLETALRTQEAIDYTGVINQVGHMARYADVTAHARDLLSNRPPLNLGFGRFLCRMSPAHPWWGKFSASGGQMVEQSSHVFDLLRYFMGEIEAVQAFGHAGTSDIADFPDSTVCNLRFESGAVGNVVSTCVARAQEGFTVELTGRDLYLRLGMDTRLTGQMDGEPVDYLGEETGYFRQIERFLRAVQERNQSLVRSSYADAVKTLAVTLAANRSLETGAVETVASVYPTQAVAPAAG